MPAVKNIALMWGITINIPLSDYYVHQGRSHHKGGAQLDGVVIGSLLWGAICVKIHYI